MEILGYLFAMVGLFFSIIAWGQITHLSLELKQIKVRLAKPDVKIEC